MRNGAGKTTTMRVILGLDVPTSGSAHVNGRDYRALIRPLHQVGALPDASSLHPARTAEAHLLSVARSNGIARRRVTEMLQLTGLEAVANVLVRSPRAAELTALTQARGATVQPQDDGVLAVTGLDAPAIGDLAAGQGIAVHALIPRSASLEDAYLDLTDQSTDFRAATPERPQVIRHTAGPWGGWLGRFTLLEAARQVTALHPATNLFAPAISLVVLLAWPAAALLAAAVVITRRDA